MRAPDRRPSTGPARTRPRVAVVLPRGEPGDILETPLGHGTRRGDAEWNTERKEPR
ncbi:MULTISPECIES: hypothetical protein [unclassified Streptomyces]|uniref:hypothetical protein n=1 Tax=unclassified Streptomyces TaxID=2593676 RepID=UPI00224CC6B7|nr:MULTISPECIES: hypothetical protein [unclassified Streptomyces]MCX4398926.1 hypothetical protein [Streptomyces sp. NBC_01767]WSP51214.1 hypothetical protein OG348_38270 [Streptomyces sp. NBC_01243]